jgi:phosphoribosyl-AMP cyclohydrolase
VARGDLLADSVAATSVLDLVKYDERGLVPVVAQEADGAVLMLAWANRAALEETLTTGRGTYWSRSRQELWRKGDTSGHRQEVTRIAVDCDGDAVLYTLRQTGPACHTGARSCFFTSQEI